MVLWPISKEGSEASIHNLSIMSVLFFASQPHWQFLHVLQYTGNLDIVLQQSPVWRHFRGGGGGRIQWEKKKSVQWLFYQGLTCSVFIFYKLWLITCGTLSCKNDVKGSGLYAILPHVDLLVWHSDIIIEAWSASIPVSLSLFLVVTASATCPPGWYMYNTYCYSFFGSINPATLKTQGQIAPLIWTEARAMCEQMGTNLVSIHNNNTQNFLVSQVMSLNAGWYSFWTGLNDRGQEGGYSWTDGTALGYTSWAVHEPNDMRGSEDCMEVITHTWKGYYNHWNDESCNSRRPYICMAPAGKTTLHFQFLFLLSLPLPFPFPLPSIFHLHLKRTLCIYPIKTTLFWRVDKNDNWSLFFFKIMK